MRAVYALLKLRYRRSAARYALPPSQEALLFSMLHRNKDSAYGKEYGFGSICSITEYRNRVPVVRYEDLVPRIDAIVRGDTGVLTEEPVLLLEPTGGSSGHSKRIPYTKTLRRQFQHSVEAWLYDLYTNYPGLDRGRAYWMITPPFPREDLPEGTGFQDDASYLGSLGAKLMSRLLITPNITAGMHTEDFYKETLTALCKEENLRLLSVWNPSLLLNLLDTLSENARAVGKRLPKQRAAALEQAVDASDLKLLWPHLTLLSCWADSSAKEDAKRLSERLPGVVLQPKGLLSTECMVSFPTKESLAHGGMLPAYHSTYLEFRQDGAVFSLTQLKDNEDYEVIATTGGGFYRYDTGDRVRVTGRLRGLPLFRFLGRAHTVDLVGEKLTPGFVEHVFSHLDGFYLLAPSGKHYVLYTNADITSAQAEQCLIQGYHYKLARDLGQLGPVRVFRITGDAERQYLDNGRRQGQRLGDIKPVRLSPRTDFIFTGAYDD